MTNFELNQFILYYFKDNRTKSAIMLTGDWGTGKSYYIQNELIPFLKEKTKDSNSCIVVSLYGLKSVNEISKSLYLESRMQFLANGSEKLETGKFVVKTVVKGVTSFLGIDISKSEEELQKLYQSVNLDSKLVIFEDIERSKIDIIDLLGYIYNLVEEDNIKVLLVANEDDILKYQDSDPDDKGNTYKIPTENTVAYLKAKEKTISDTIHFNGNFNSAIHNIIKSYGNPMLTKYAEKERIENIVSIMYMLKNFNLRFLLFACQKITDLFCKIPNLEEPFVETIFYSVLAFSLRIKSGNFPEWEGNDLISKELGIGKHPLYRFCYDYIRWQEFNFAEVQRAFDAHKEMKLYDINGDSCDDVDLNVIFNYATHYATEVCTALQHIESRLENPEDIPLYSYGKLAYYLVQIHLILGFDYTRCNSNMINNMKRHGGRLDPDILFVDIYGFDDEKGQALYNTFKKDLRDVMISLPKIDFSYSPEDIHLLHMKAIQSCDSLTSGHAFICKFAMDKILKMLFRCSPSQLHEFRQILFLIYRHATKRDFLESDRLYMEKLVLRVRAKLGNFPRIDGIIALQMRYLISNLETFIEQLQ